jgi:restriction system protein
MLAEEGRMPRRRQSGAEDFMDLVALMPWWAGVLLAIVSYLVLHSLSAPPKPQVVPPGQIGQFVTHGLLAGFAAVGQYLVPVLCLLGALGSFLRRQKRQALMAGVTSSKSAHMLNDMSWQEFEMLVGEAFRLQGFQVTELGGAAADGGVDLVLRKGTETHLVQCKQWKALKVGADVVRQLYGVMAARGAASGFVVTSGTFTPDAISFADGRNLHLVDGEKLFGLIRQAKASLEAGAKSVRTATAKVADGSLCPVCSSAMVRRTARQGANAGNQFWGCSRFPACRGTR